MLHMPMCRTQDLHTLKRPLQKEGPIVDTLSLSQLSINGMTESVKHVKVILFSGGFETPMLRILQIMIVLVLYCVPVAPVNNSIQQRKA
jgi:hypothetical protein